MSAPLTAPAPDRRLTPANGRVAALALKGRVEAEHFTAGTPATVAVPVADLRRAPDGPRDRQILMGQAVTVYEERDGWAFLQSDRDGYVGYVAAGALGPLTAPTHHVATPATHLYEDEDIKSPDLARLSFGARLTVTAERRKFWETTRGFVPKAHLWPLDKRFGDPVTAAALHFGVPYLWGGNSTLGIDCSGLVSAALTAAGLPCPGDSDLQRAALGRDVPEGEEARRGDLWFWRGHVGIVVEPGTLLHANAHHMAVAYEPLSAAVARIEAQGEGPVLARKRL